MYYGDDFSNFNKIKIISKYCVIRLFIHFKYYTVLVLQMNLVRVLQFERDIKSKSK